MEYSDNNNGSGSPTDPWPDIRRLYRADGGGSACWLGLWFIPVLFGSLLATLAPPVLAQDPVLAEGGFTETVLNEAGAVNVTVVDGAGFGPNDHGHRITNTFLSNTGQARLVQLNGWAVYKLGEQSIVGINATGLVHHALGRGRGIFWSATDSSPSYDTATAGAWDDDGDRPFYKSAVAAAGWMATQDILFISSLENPTVVSADDQRAIYCDDYPHIDGVTGDEDYWIPICGAMDDYIAYSGVAIDRTIFVGAIRDGTIAASAVRAGGAFEQNTIYVESPDGSTSHATPVLAAYATNLAAANPTWGATRLKQELMALATDETLPHDSGPVDRTETRVVKVIRPANAPTAIEVVGDEIPDAFVLEQNYPNPFNPSTTIEFSLDKAQRITLAVYDMLGHEVSVLMDDLQPAARYSVSFDASDLASGTYLYVLRTEEQVAVKTMSLIK